MTAVATHVKKPDTGTPAAHVRARYRCFLPDLAGLAGICRAGPMPDTINSNIRCLVLVLPWKTHSLTTEASRAPRFPENPLKYQR